MKKRSSKQANFQHKGRLLALLECLNSVEENTEKVQSRGCFWYSHDSFMINIDIFNHYTGGSYRGTTTKYFHSYKMKWHRLSKEIKQSIPKKINFDNFSDQKHWSYYKCENFTQNSTENDVMKMKCCPKNKNEVRHQKHQQPTNNLKCNSIQNQPTVTTNRLFFIQPSSTPTITRQMLPRKFPIPQIMNKPINDPPSTSYGQQDEENSGEPSLQYPNLEPGLIMNENPEEEAISFNFLENTGSIDFFESQSYDDCPLLITNHQPNNPQTMPNLSTDDESRDQQINNLSSIIDLPAFDEIKGQHNENLSIGPSVNELQEQQNESPIILNPHEVDELQSQLNEFNTPENQLIIDQLDDQSDETHFNDQYDFGPYF